MIIKMQTTAATSGSYYMKRGSTLQVRGSLGAGETIEIEVPDGVGGWLALTEGAEAVVLSSDNMQLAAFGATVIRLSKGTTAASVGVVAIAS